MEQYITISKSEDEKNYIASVCFSTAHTNNNKIVGVGFSKLEAVGRLLRSITDFNAWLDANKYQHPSYVDDYLIKAKLFTDSFLSDIRGFNETHTRNS